MTASDPHRTLGLRPGATQAEIKRAYRRLVKQYHPDSAGEPALPRFLAIQAAYEALTDGGSAPGLARPGARGSRPDGPQTPPWQADPGRARATREAYRARTRRPAGSAEPGAAESAGGAGTAGGVGGAGTAGGVGGAGTAGRARTGPRERRHRKATIGSTSYDGADREPFDPAWEGATWYGAGSGTYWTVNPKEYADPRKHGPEYLARTKRSPDPAAAPAPPAASARSAAHPRSSADTADTAAPTSAAAAEPNPRPRGIARWLGWLPPWRRPRVR